MSVPLSVKWISPFRDLIVQGFQSLPLTLGGTIAFFAANSTNMIFLYLLFILALIIPFFVAFTQWIVPQTNSVLMKIFGQDIATWKSIVLLILSGFAFFGGYSITTITENDVSWGQIALQYPGILLFFGANEYFGTNKSPIDLPPKSICNIVPVKSSDTTTPIAPSYWLTSMSFLIFYLFKNALDNYNHPIDPATNPQKVTRRKIQTVFAMIFILIIGIFILGFRVFYTGCETMSSTVSSLALAWLLLVPFYKLANVSGIDFFGMFQNINVGCDSPQMACILKN